MTPEDYFKRLFAQPNDPAIALARVQAMVHEQILRVYGLSLQKNAECGPRGRTS
jgi:hypothetical protein